MKSSGKVITLCKKCGFEIISTNAKLAAGKDKYCSKSCAISEKNKGNTYAYKNGLGYDDRQYVKAYNKRNPEKKLAHNRLTQKVRSGKITRKPCEVCGTTEKIQAHHDDYSKPFEVRWLCRQHHREFHGLQKPQPQQKVA